MRKLVISPHIDDDILGCGGILDNETLVVYCGADESLLNNRPPMQIRIDEAELASDYLGYKYILLDNKVNNYKIPDLIGSFEKIINENHPDEIYIPYPSYNQDHRTTYDACMVALRPHDINFFVNTVFVYEQPHVFLWDNTHNISSSFKPNYFKEIDIEKKIKSYKLMKSQVRPFRSPEILRSMAMLRGSQSNCQYAEAFQLIRKAEK